MQSAQVVGNAVYTSGRINLRQRCGLQLADTSAAPQLSTCTSCCSLRQKSSDSQQVRNHAAHTQ